MICRAFAAPFRHDLLMVGDQSTGQLGAGLSPKPGEKLFAEHGPLMSSQPIRRNLKTNLGRFDA
jgi:hypothetical protein